MRLAVGICALIISTGLLFGGLWWLADGDWREIGIVLSVTFGFPTLAIGLGFLIAWGFSGI